MAQFGMKRGPEVHRHLRSFEGLWSRGQCHFRLMKLVDLYQRKIMIEAKLPIFSCSSRARRSWIAIKIFSIFLIFFEIRVAEFDQVARSVRNVSLYHLFVAVVRLLQYNQSTERLIQRLNQVKGPSGRDSLRRSQFQWIQSQQRKYFGVVFPFQPRYDQDFPLKKRVMSHSNES